MKLRATLYILLLSLFALSCASNLGDCREDPNSCPEGQFCTADGRCVIDCRADPSICAAGLQCLPDGSCGTLCGADQVDCGSFCCNQGELCQNGGCIPATACTGDETQCGPFCCGSDQSCVQETCIDNELLQPCNEDNDCQNDTRCVNGTCLPYGVPPGEVSNPDCQVLVPLGVFQPAIQCEWQPESSFTPCTLTNSTGGTLVGNPNYPNGLKSPQCPGREVCVDPNVTDNSNARVCIDPFRQVLSTPMVVNFNFPAGSNGNEAGIINGRPSLVFASYDQLDGGSPAGTSNGILRIVDGATCETLYTIEGTDAATGLALKTMGASPVALGDIDLATDNRPEIVAHAQGGGMWAFKYNQAQDKFVTLWHSKNTDGSINQHNRGSRSVDAFGVESFDFNHWSGPSIYDIDNDGVPEVMMSGTVYNAQGVVRFESNSTFEADYRFANTGQFPVVADVDLDGAPELISGDKIYNWVSAGAGQTGTWVPDAAFVADAGNFDGTVALGDFGDFLRRNGAADTGFPEIVVVKNSVYVETSDGRRIFGPITMPGGGLGGPPTIGDFDGDGEIEFASAGGRAYTIFDFECVAPVPNQTCTQDSNCGAGFSCPSTGRCSVSSTACNVNTDCPSAETCVQLSPSRICVPDGCEGNGFRWSQVSQDLSSNRTGSSIFDFEGDGKVEAVYADECYTRVYDGASGDVLFSQFHTSCTWYENPIVVDVDGDLRSEIVVPSNENCERATTCFANAFPVSLGADGVALTADDIRVDPIFPGLRCESNADCPGGPCVDSLCRCSSSSQCGGGDSVCSPVIPGSTTVTNQNVCRAAFRIDTTDGRPGITGIRIYRDVADRWVGSRPIWNQHAYDITNVEDDGSIPSTSQREENWLVVGLNNFRQNVQGALNPDLFPDLTGHQEDSQCFVNPDGSRTLVLQAALCNRGAQDTGAGVFVSFYEVADQDTPICTVESTAQLAPGECQVLQCEVNPAPINTPTDYFIRVDDTGNSSGERAECLEGNNQAVISNQTCLSVD